MWRTFRNMGRSNSTTVPPKLSVLRISWIDAAEITKLYWAIEKTATCSRGRLSRGVKLELTGWVIAILLAGSAGQWIPNVFQSQDTFDRCPRLDPQRPFESLRQAFRK